MNFHTSKCFFSTLTVNKWTSIFEDFPELISIIYDSFEFMTKRKWIDIYAFVIMRDHVHILWTVNKEDDAGTIISKFKAFTGREILKNLKSLDFEYYQDNFISSRKDRDSKFWKLVSGNLRIQHPIIFNQKLKYIHQNPIKGSYKSCDKPFEYRYSSAKSYYCNQSEFMFLTLASTLPRIKIET